MPEASNETEESQAFKINFLQCVYAGYEELEVGETKESVIKERERVYFHTGLPESIKIKKIKTITTTTTTMATTAILLVHVFTSSEWY